MSVTRRGLWVLGVLLVGMACSGEGGSPGADAAGADADAAVTDTAGTDVPDAAPPADVPPDGPEPTDVAEDAPPEAAGDTAETLEPPPGPSLFVEGCPLPGRARASVITNAEQRVEGPDAVARPGDFLLMNEVAAFVIEALEHRNTYYIYSGIPVDAVALRDCRQAGPERFEELAFMLGTLNLGSFEHSTLRAFRPTKIEVLNDGASGCAAVVRATGTDDTFWLVEDELIRQAMQHGDPKHPSEPYGLEITIDYVLEPGSPVLRVELTYRNTSNQRLTLLEGQEIMFGDSTPPRYYADVVVSAGGLSLDAGLPWIAASAGDGAWAFSMAEASMGTLEISGVRAFIDTRKALAPWSLAPANQPGESFTRTVFLAVGPSDANSATRALAAVNDEPMPSGQYALVPVEGQVVAAGTGAALAGATVLLQARNVGGEWGELDSFVTDAEGRFAGQIPDFVHKNLPFQVVAQVDGRPLSEPLVVDPAAPAPLTLEVPEGGTLTCDVRDADSGLGLPAKVLLWQGGGIARRLYPVGAPLVAPVPPGTYQVSVTRGYEYTTWQGEVVVAAGQDTPLAVSLAHVVDTTGFLSFDGHLHAGPSGDNVITIPERIATVVAEGLEVAAATDHEYVSDWSWAVDLTGLSAWVATFAGQEVTATLPEHLGMYPVVPDFETTLRGGIVPWYGRSLAELFGLLREREGGTGIVQLNHPRQGCNYLCLAGYDRVLGTTTLADPTLLGFQADAVTWSWNFDAVEYQNGSRAVFVQPGNEDETGLFDDWASFLNHGHRVTALGNSDTHDWGAPGNPRNFYQSPTDDPAGVDPTDVVTAIKAGQVLVSSGAFARVTLNGTTGLGDTVTDTDGSVDLALRVEAPPTIDVTYARVFVNCDQVLVIPATDPHGVVKLDGTFPVPVDTDAHVVVMAFGADPMPLGLDGYDAATTPRVTTNALYVDADGDGAWTAPGGKACAYDPTVPAF
jgi:hypothetical protein